jgi:Plasmid pRiA4b ORF-3-like protein
MANAGTHGFRVSLNPKLYREIEIASDNMLSDLALSIIRSFGFDFDHPYGFYSLLKGNILRSPVKYELFADMAETRDDSEAGSVERTRICDVFRKTGRKMTFLFDYGDNWEFRVELIGQNAKEREAKYPRVLKKVGRAPEQYPQEEDL